MITSKDIIKAHKVLKGVVVETPLDYDHYLSEKYGAKIYLKKENAQRVRSFKIRGAYYAISQLTAKERERGVVCASAGNHARQRFPEKRQRLDMLPSGSGNRPPQPLPQLPFQSARR